MHTSTYAAEMQQRQPLLCSIAQVHLLKSLIGAEPPKTKKLKMQTENFEHKQALVK